MKKAVLMGISLAIVCALLCGCAPQSQQTKEKITVSDSLAGKPVLVGDIPCAFPLVAEPATLNFLAFRSCDTEYDDVYVWNKYEQMTGVDIQWTTTTQKERAEAVYTALMNDMDVDLIIRCKVSANRLTQYGEGGLILDLAKGDLLKNNAPNCWAYLQSHPDTLASVTNPDGSIYALPQVNSGAELRVSRKLYINKNWLANVNMELPKTTEDLYRLLKAFKEQDANGNGDTDDEIPLCSQDWLSIQEALSGAFGLMNRGAHNQVADWDEAAGKLRLTAASEGYRDFLLYFQRLYTEGLIDSNIFAMTKEEWTNNAVNDRIGVYTNTNLADFPADMVENWVGIEEALEGPNGDKLWTAIRANFHSTGNAIIPSRCKDPALVLRWLDYFWTDEGTLFYHMGIEGETFTAKEDGSYDYAPSIYDEMKKDNLSFDDTVSKYTPYPGGGNPTVELAPYFMGGEMAPVPAATARALFAYGPKEYWPSFTFTAAETETLNAIKTDIDKYISSMRIDFITGTTPMSEWDSYIEQLHMFKVDEMLAIYQAALDRYQAVNPSV